MACRLAAVSRGRGRRATRSTAMTSRCSETSSGATTPSKVPLLNSCVWGRGGGADQAQGIHFLRVPLWSFKCYVTQMGVGGHIFPPGKSVTKV